MEDFESRAWFERRVALACLAAPLLLLVACGDEYTDDLAMRGYGAHDEALFQTGPTWPASADGITRIPVCYRLSTGYTSSQWFEARRQVEEALRNSWQLWAKIEFTGFVECNRALGGTIAVDLINETCGGCGEAGGIGYPGASTPRVMSLRLAGVDEALQRTIIIHEFGHELGFGHEQYRPDAWDTDGSPLCTDDPRNDPLGTQVTHYYDDVSVMNYCAPRARNSLSAGDIEGAQARYGITATARLGRAYPAVFALGL